MTPWQIIATVALFWALLLATGWIVFVGILRWRHLNRPRPAPTVVSLGGSVTDSEPMSEAREAFLEEVARAKGRR